MQEDRARESRFMAGESCMQVVQVCRREWTRGDIEGDRVDGGDEFIWRPVAA